MKKLKLSEVQLFRLQSARNHAGTVLHQIKTKPLEGNALETIKILEAAMSNIDVVLISQ